MSRKKPGRKKSASKKPARKKPAPKKAAAKESAASSAGAPSAGPGGASAVAEPTEFDPSILDRTVISIPLLERMHPELTGKKTHADGEPEGMSVPYDVIIDANFAYEKGRAEARLRIQDLIDGIVPGSQKEGWRGFATKNEYSHQYVYARLSGSNLLELVKRDREKIEREVGESRVTPHATAAIYRIWPDFELERFAMDTISTVKADAAHRSFSAQGHGIVWAVMDSGIDRNHPHFALHGNLELTGELRHADFSGTDFSEAGEDVSDSYPEDENGHGTHVAGIIAGELDPARLNEKNERENPGAPPVRIHAMRNIRGRDGESYTEAVMNVARISGMAPKCKLLNLKVLDRRAKGRVSNILAAIEYVQRANSYGRHIRIHGVNLSLGYSFEPEWFACGHSPLCVEVDRLVKSGVVVVVAAGNTGYGRKGARGRSSFESGLEVTINDPGNASEAITVGSTHRSMPHIYGVSYFSSKGPTADGRMKPDLLAPGEKVISCAAGGKKKGLADSWEREFDSPDAVYVEDSGTSMAAPHVSGCIAALLSIRNEFIGKPERVKEIFTKTATDLRRLPHYQGSGLVDLMRAIQSI
jgi:subtilisin family serine protease